MGLSPAPKRRLVDADTTTHAEPPPTPLRCARARAPALTRRGALHLARPPRIKRRVVRPADGSTAGGGGPKGV